MARTAGLKAKQRKTAARSAVAATATVGAAAGAGIHTGVLLALGPFVRRGLHYAFAKVAAVSAMFLWNFASRRLYTRRLIKRVTRHAAEVA